MTDSTLKNFISQCWQPTLEDFAPAHRIEAEFYWEQNSGVSSTPAPVSQVRLYRGDTSASPAANQLRQYACAA